VAILDGNALPKCIKKGDKGGIQMSKINRDLLLVNIEDPTETTMEIGQRNKTLNPNNNGDWPKKQTLNPNNNGDWPKRQTLNPNMEQSSKSNLNLGAM
jgi:hypothetical protein